MLKLWLCLHISVNIPKSADLYTLNGWIVCYVKYVSRKLLIKKGEFTAPGCMVCIHCVKTCIRGVLKNASCTYEYGQCSFSERMCSPHWVHGIHYVKTCIKNILNSGGKRFENSIKCPICCLNILKPNSDNFLWYFTQIRNDFFMTLLITLSLQRCVTGVWPFALECRCFSRGSVLTWNPSRHLLGWGLTDALGPHCAAPWSFYPAFSGLTLFPSKIMNLSRSHSSVYLEAIASFK